MKYTRYDVKSKKKKDDWKTTLLLILVVVALAIGIGSLIFFKLFPKDFKALDKAKTTQSEVNKGGSQNNTPKNTETPPVTTSKEENKKEETKSTTTYTMVQYGYFSNNESAMKVKNEVGQGSTVLKDGDKFRVVGFIGEDDKAIKVSENLTSKSVENTKTRFQVHNDDTCDKEIIEMINGLLNITNKLNEAEVSKVKTAEFKTWTNKLSDEKDATNYKVFSKLKENINKLPEELNKNGIEAIYQIVFETLSNYK